jgi:two-component system, OmpR family, osmolarity sensor histidine kinase EnvZ
MKHSINTRFSRFLARHLPRGLYSRAMLILIVPLVLLQLIMSGLILNSYWDSVTKALGRSLSREIGLITELYQKSDRSDAAVMELQRMVKDRLRHELVVTRNAKPLPPQKPVPYIFLFEHKMQQYLERETKRPFWINTDVPSDVVEINVEVEPGVIFKLTTEAERARATGTPWLLGLMLLSSLLIAGAAATFLRRQIAPILELAKAAQAFGLGREFRPFKPRGALEVRVAGQAVLDMKRRIARHVDQRTTMLAGVSHDLRTILTRFKLGLAMLGEAKQAKPLHEDVNEMQRMLEDYMSFAKGDGGEVSASINIREKVNSVVANVVRAHPCDINVVDLPELTVDLKPNAFRRLLMNVVSNAARYGTEVRISGEVIEDRLWIYVDDNGPGIPPEKRDDAFRPFVRLDESRNMDDTGSGLGLAIALDIAHAHGGDVELDDSPLGGLRVGIRIPV